MNGASLDHQTPTYRISTGNQQRHDLIPEGYRILSGINQILQQCFVVAILLQACRVLFRIFLSLNGPGHNRVDKVMHDAEWFLQFVFPKLCKRPMHAKAHAEGQDVLSFSEGGHEARARMIFRGRRGLPGFYIVRIRKAARERTHVVAEEEFCGRVKCKPRSQVLQRDSVL